MAKDKDPKADPLAKIVTRHSAKERAAIGKATRFIKEKLGGRDGKGDDKDNGKK